MGGRARIQNDCSGVISAVSFGVFCVLGSLFLFYLVSGPPTFLEVETLARGDTFFHNTTWSRLWCGCLKLESANNHTPNDVSLYRLPLDSPSHMSLSQHLSYDVVQNISDPYSVFEFWEAYFHPGAVATANYSFNRPVTFYFAPRYYVDGLNREANYEGHSVMKITNATQGSIVTPKFNVSGGWGFVWEKDFKNQKSTSGVVSYHFDMLEYAIPSVPANDTLKGAGEFCWAPSDPSSSWLLVAGNQESDENQKNEENSMEISLISMPQGPKARLQARLLCVPRYRVTIPVTAVPVVLALILETLIIVCCIVRPRRALRQRYESV